MKLKKILIILTIISTLILTFIGVDLINNSGSVTELQIKFVGLLLIGLGILDLLREIK